MKLFFGIFGALLTVVFGFMLLPVWLATTYAGSWTMFVLTVYVLFLASIVIALSIHAGRRADR